MKAIRNLLRVTAAAVIFASGYFCGALLQPVPAEAQVGDLMKKAEGAGGSLGTAAQLGTTISDMQKNVDGLNQNIKVLNQIKTALGG